MTHTCHCTALRQASAFATEFYDAALEPLGIKVTMFRLLRHIGRAQGASITDLADQVGLDRSTLGRNLRVLERQNLIEPAKGQDKRARNFVLSDRGRAMLEAATPLWHDAQNAFADTVGPEVIGLLDQLSELTNKTHTVRGDRG